MIIISTMMTMTGSIKLVCDNAVDDDDDKRVCGLMTNVWP